MSVARKGKIARLGREIRAELDRRLDNSEPGPRVLAWLNGLPEAQRVLAEEFGGRAITKHNLSDWRRRGHEDWLRKQEAGELAGRLEREAAGLQGAGGPLSDKLAVWLAARYAIAARQLAREAGGELDLDLLRQLCKDVVALRRGDHSAARLEMKRDAGGVKRGA